MNNQKGLSAIWVVVLVIFALVLGTIGGYYFKNKEDQSNTTTTTKTSTPTTTSKATSTSISTSTTASSETANWKIYTNNKYGYSINYPSDWTYREFPDRLSGAGFRLVSSSSDFQNEFIAIDINSRPASQKTQTFSEYVKTAASSSIQGYESLVSNTAVKTNSGITGYKTTWKISASDDQKEHTSLPITFFDAKNSDNDTVMVTLDNSKYLEIYDKMIITFQLNK